MSSKRREDRAIIEGASEAFNTMQALYHALRDIGAPPNVFQELRRDRLQQLAVAKLLKIMHQTPGTAAPLFDKLQQYDAQELLVKYDKPLSEQFQLLQIDFTGSPQRWKEILGRHTEQASHQPSWIGIRQVGHRLHDLPEVLTYLRKYDEELADMNMLAAFLGQSEVPWFNTLVVSASWLMPVRELVTVKYANREVGKQTLWEATYQGSQTGFLANTQCLVQRKSPLNM